RLRGGLRLAAEGAQAAAGLGAQLGLGHRPAAAIAAATAAATRALLRSSATFASSDRPPVRSATVERRKGVTSFPRIPRDSASASASRIAPSTSAEGRACSGGGGTQRR